MKRLVLLAALTLGVGVAVRPASPALAGPLGVNVASETYYRADVAAGTLTAQVDLQVQNAAGKDLLAVSVWTMPGARNIAAKQGDTALTVAAPVVDAKTGVPHVAVTLAKPLRPTAKTELSVTYDVAPQSSARVNLAPGSLEAMFVSQGPGSFVFVDVPKAGDNYFEPGCLEVAKQPAEVSGAGLVRWVCGEAKVIAVNGYTPEVAERCARLDDSCRQRLTELPFAGFAQSITDTSAHGTLEADLPMMGGTVQLRLKYFRRDQAWAERQFDVAKAALPRLEAVFGYPYPHDQVLLRQSHFILDFGLAGLAFPDDGEMLVTKTGQIDDEVTVHELAHQWAGFNLESNWLWEGLAEYGLHRVAPDLGVAPRDWGWGSAGYADPLNTWNAGSEVDDPDYWYGKSGAFWHAYEQAVGGPAAMTSVLAQTYDPKKPLDGRWFMDAGERVSGANLDALFLQWVFPETATQLLAERRAAHDLVRPLQARAAAMGMGGLPTDLAADLAAWQFGGTARAVDAANAVLDSYTTLLTEQEALGLPAPGRVGEAWGTGTVAAVGTVVNDQRLAMGAIASARKEFAGGPEDAAGPKQVEAAVAAYGAGEFAEAKRLASTASTAAANSAAAGRMIALAREKQADFEPSFLSRVGLLGSDPDGDLAAAEKAAAAGDGAAALGRARSAYEAWDGADAAGLIRLAACAAVLSALTAGGWWAWRHFDRTAEPVKPLGAGHTLPTEERRSWRDWENTGS